MNVRLIITAGLGVHAAEVSLLAEVSGYGELFVVRAVRRGLDTREKVFRSAGRGVTRDVVDACIDLALDGGLIMHHPVSSPGKPERFILTVRGFEAAQGEESRLSSASRARGSSQGERAVDKALGAVLLATGFFVLYIGITLAMGFVNQPAPEMQAPDLGPVSSLEELQAAVVNSLVLAMRPVFWASVQLGATALLILAGGLVMARGVSLFKS